jgi:MGT family glycosyltransferase
MNIGALLTHLHSLDIRIWADGDQLCYSAPKGALAPELRGRLAEHKTEILAFLQGQLSPTARPGAPERALGATDSDRPPISQPRRYLFVLLEVGGTTPTLLGLAHRLVERGHNVWAIGNPCKELEVRAAGCAFIPYRHARHRHDKAASTTLFKDYEAKTPADAIDMLADAFACAPALEYARDVLEAIEQYPVDAVVVSEFLFGGCFAAEKVGLPCAMVFWGMYTLPYANMPHHGSLGWLSDQFARFMFQRFDAYGLPALQSARAVLGLPALHTVLDCIYRLEHVLIMSSPAFDPEARILANVRFIGPTIDTPIWRTDTWSLPWPPDHPEPLVVVAFGGSFQNQHGLVQRVIDALDGWPVRGLVTLTPALESVAFRASPNVVLSAAVWRKQVFPVTSAVVTHAGHLTVMQALSHGVPLVCMPLGRDHHGIAARVAAHNVGLRLPTTADTEAIRQAVQQVVHDPHFRTQAQQLGQRIMAEPGSATAIVELEQLAARMQPAG